MFFGIMLSLVFLSVYVVLSGYVVVRSWKSRCCVPLIDVLILALIALVVSLFCYLVAFMPITQERIISLFWLTVTSFGWFYCLGRAMAIFAQHRAERR